MYLQFSFEANSSLSVSPSLISSLPLLLSSLSGTFADRVQLPDDDGASAEREPQCDWGRPLHASWLSATVEGPYAAVRHKTSQLCTQTEKWPT